MEQTTFSCVICKKKDNSDKVIIFNEERLQKCRNILKIRQQNNLKFAKVVLPSDLTTPKGYHAQCYRNFSALMKQYTEKSFATLSEPSTSSSGKVRYFTIIIFILIIYLAQKIKLKYM